MKTQTAFVGPDSRVKFYAIPSIYLCVAVIINPWHSKNDGALWFYHSFQKHFSFILWIFLYKWDNRFCNFMHRLQKLRFVTVRFLDKLYKSVNFVFHVLHYYELI